MATTIEKDWTPERVERLQKRIILSIHSEFVYHQRDQRAWDAGFEVMNNIGRTTPIKLRRE